MTADSPTPTNPYLVPLAEGVWAYIQPDGGWMVNNMGFIAGKETVFSVDVTSTEPRTQAYLEAIEQATGKPVSHLLYTHSHPDHCNGASLLPQAEIIAHQMTATELQHPHGVEDHIFTKFEVGSVQMRMPTRTYSDRITLKWGERELQIVHPGQASHSSGDSYLFLPDDSVLFAGDLVFNGGTPFALSGSLSGWIETIGQLQDLGARTIVPGHGPVGGPEVLENVREYLEFVLAASHRAVEQGLKPLEAALALDLGKFAQLIDAERIVGNLHRGMAEIQGKDIHFPTVFQQMYEYNGSRPLLTHA